MFANLVCFLVVLLVFGYDRLRHAVFGRGFTRQRAALVLEWLALCCILYFLTLLSGFLIGHPLTDAAGQVDAVARWLTGVESVPSKVTQLSGAVFYNAVALYVGLAGVAGGVLLTVAWAMKRPKPECSEPLRGPLSVRHQEAVDKV